MIGRHSRSETWLYYSQSRLSSQPSIIRLHPPSSCRITSAVGVECYDAFESLLLMIHLAQTIFNDQEISVA